MTTHIIKLSEPSSSILEAINRWENDPTLIPLIRPNRNKLDLERRGKMTLDDLTKRLENHHMYLIYLNELLVGAWIGITIGESEGRGKGIGYVAIQYLEEQIKMQGLKRIELGVFEFNKQAQKLYYKLGYKKIGSIESFTFWQDKMWTDIRMEKYV
ncbi:GNAT family N-acetyltransferase [Paenisporosarcina sp. TG20]|uniref:GNAT family N-acetyltransferase n=1 Tax=Paenisporosarcina sp. TG20 TaxID=1211706 RepID=UPI000302117E|nr:GNAT family N-acetyltransferase [Paenisporosarcina sp. TG20]